MDKGEIAQRFQRGLQSSALLVLKSLKSGSSALLVLYHIVMH
jgi:hypothetical protein